MGNAIAFLYLLSFQAMGIFTAARLLTRERGAIRLWLGSAMGSTAMIWLPIVFSFFFDFSPVSQILGLAAGLLLTLTCAFLTRKWKRGRPLRWRELRTPTLLTLPLMAFCAYVLYTHTLQPRTDGGLWTGQCTWGDMNLHLGIMTSMARQRIFPPEYSILPGTRLGYPFLSDSVSATLYQLGAGWRFAYAAPMIVALLQVFFGAWFVLKRMLRRDRASALAFTLFFLGGGFGFAYFFEGSRANPENFTRIFSAFYETPTNLVDNNIRWVNFVVDMLIPQRATLFGWALFLPCLYALYRAAFERRREMFWLLGVFAGALPMIHTHSFFALGMISFMWLIFYALRARRLGAVLDWLPYVGLVAALALPQLLYWTLRQATGETFLRPHFNWANLGDPWLWFWVKNVGLIFILAPFAFLQGSRARKFAYSGAILIFVVAEAFLFQPNDYDNNKLFFVWFFLSCMIVAEFLCWVYDRLKGMRGRGLLAAAVMAVMTLSSVLTMGREWVSEFQLYGPEQVKAVSWIEENTAVDAVFLTATNHNNAVSSLTGRNIVCGTSSFLYYHGVDYQGVEADVRRMFTEPENFDALAKARDVDYVYLGPFERSEYGAEDWMFEELPLVYEADGVAIYAVSERARAGAAQALGSENSAGRLNDSSI